MLALLMNTIIAMVVGVLVFLGLSLWANTPLVYKQYPEGYCIKVESPSGEFNCESMPEKFETVWVKESPVQQHMDMIDQHMNMMSEHQKRFDEISAELDELKGD